MSSSFTAVNRELFSPLLLYVKQSACKLVGICSKKKMIKSFLLATSPPALWKRSVNRERFFLGVFNQQ